MKKYLNGKMIEMSPGECIRYEEERMQMPSDDAEITAQERIEALETAFLELAEVVLNG